MHAGVSPACTCCYRLATSKTLLCVPDLHAGRLDRHFEIALASAAVRDQVLVVEAGMDALEGVVEGDEAPPGEERLAARLVREPLERALAVGDRDVRAAE